MQLRGNPDQYDLPQLRPIPTENAKGSQAEFDEADLEFLLKYISPTYLAPDYLEQIANHFDENSSIALPTFLCKSFARRLQQYVTDQELAPLPAESTKIETNSPWRVSQPPHKHRFLYQQPSRQDELRTSQDESPITELLDILLPSRQFRCWLELATLCAVKSHDVLARRFRRGIDYTLATEHSGEPRIERAGGGAGGVGRRWRA
jgi:hypothetical protein